MNFNLDEAIEILERTPETLTYLLGGLSSGWLTCNEGANTWNSLEVVTHLIEGEKNNWIPRMNHILTKCDVEVFPPFDRFSHLQHHQGKEINPLLKEFKRCREESLLTLKNTLTRTADLECTGRHPEFGLVKLRELLSTWAVHDLTHINQITRVLAKRYKEDVGPWSENLSILK